MLGGGCKSRNKAERVHQGCPFKAITGVPKGSKASNVEDLIKVSILPYENKSFQIGASMPH